MIEKEINQFKKYKNKNTGEIVEAKYIRQVSAPITSDKVVKISVQEMMCLKNEWKGFTMYYGLEIFNKKFEELDNE